ncbi:MAG TPA: hypothetical protein VGC66_20655, partial [Pyrinomonadaceae bacterium]
WSDFHVQQEMRYILSSYGDGIVVWFSSVSHQKITSTTVSVAIYATKSIVIKDKRRLDESCFCSRRRVL